MVGMLAGFYLPRGNKGGIIRVGQTSVFDEVFKVGVTASSPGLPNCEEGRECDESSTRTT